MQRHFPNDRSRGQQRMTTQRGAVLDPVALRRDLADAGAPGGAAEMRIVRAPGRVNLIGEHTDYNDGLVMPAAIDLETWIAFVPTDDRRVELSLQATGERDGFSLDDIGPARESWIDYVAGVAWALRERGVELRGFHGVLASTLPMSAGLSSSAALELAAAWALTAETPPPLDGMALAQAAQRAENEYVGVRSGIMDQFAVTLGRTGVALLLDCRSLDYRPIELPLERFTIVVCDTTSPRRLESSQYNARRAQCETAVRAIAERYPRVRALRDVDMGMLDEVSDVLDGETLRRCEHVIRENERVLRAEAALASGDLESTGRIFEESHESLRDLYEVSSAELDAMVRIARGTPGVVAARMTGAGFGGCTVNIVARDAVDGMREAVAREYRAATGLEGAVYVVEPAAGAGEVVS